MSIILNDEQYLTAITRCSPNIQKFLRALNNRDSCIKWARLERDGCMQKDGSFFRVVSSVRTAKEQISEYKKGRKGVESQSECLLRANEYCSAVPAWKYTLTNKGVIDNKAKISTNVWAGGSCHNWGLAVDLVLRKFGDAEIIKVSDGAISLTNYYSLIGLTQLAKDCGLEWGGFWGDFPDLAHFQDTAYSIPSKEYHYDKNMTFEFLQRLNSGLSVGGASSSGGLFSGVKNVARMGTFGVVAYLIASFMGSKRGRGVEDEKNKTGFPEPKLYNCR